MRPGASEGQRGEWGDEDVVEDALGEVEGERDGEGGMLDVVGGGGMVVGLVVDGDGESGVSEVGVEEGKKVGMGVMGMLDRKCDREDVR